MSPTHLASKTVFSDGANLDSHTLDVVSQTLRRAGLTLTVLRGANRVTLLLDADDDVLTRVREAEGHDDDSTLPPAA